MEKIGLFYGSNLGATEEVSQIFKKILKDKVEIHNIAYAGIDEMKNYSNIIVGSPTWGYGDLQDDWQFFIEDNPSIELSGKKVAIFGLGDQDAHHDVFVNAMGHLHTYFEGNNAKMIGFWPTEGYSYGNETTAVKDGKFLGLPVDEVNQPNLTEERVKRWIDLLLVEFKL